MNPNLVKTALSQTCLTKGIKPGLIKKAKELVEQGKARGAEGIEEAAKGLFE